MIGFNHWNLFGLPNNKGVPEAVGFATSLFDSKESNWRPFGPQAFSAKKRSEQQDQTWEMKLTFDDELLISKTLLRIAPVPMPSKDGMDVAEMIRGVPSKLLVVNKSFIGY